MRSLGSLVAGAVSLSTIAAAERHTKYGRALPWSDDTVKAFNESGVSKLSPVVPVRQQASRR
jgi:hypothetical protein